MPNPYSAYSAAMMPRSIQSTQDCHSRTTAAISPRKGTTTPIMFAMRSALVIALQADAHQAGVLVDPPSFAPDQFVTNRRLRGGACQFSDGSGGIVERSANSRPLRRRTAAQS